MARSPLENAYSAAQQEFRSGAIDYNEFSGRIDALEAAEDDNIFTTFGKSVARSTASTIPSAMVGVGRMTGFDALAEQGEEWEQDIGRAIQINPNEEDSVSAKLGAGFGSVAGMALTGGIGGAAAKGLAAGAARYAAATRGAAAVAKAKNVGQTAQKVGQYGVGISTGVGLSASEGARDYEAEMRKQGREMDPGARQKAALSVAGAGALDFIIPAKMLNQGARIFKMKPDDIIDGIRKGTLKAAPGKAGATAKGVAAGAVLEGGTEAAQQAWLNGVAKLQYDADRELSQGVIEAGLYGAATGGTVKGVGNYLEAKRFQRTYDEATKQIEDKQAQDTAVIEEATAKEAKQAETAAIDAKNEWLDAELRQRDFIVPDVATLEFEGISTEAATARVKALAKRLKEMPAEVREAATFDPTKTTKADYIKNHPEMADARKVGMTEAEVADEKGVITKELVPVKGVKGKKKGGAKLQAEAVAAKRLELSKRYDKLVELKKASVAEPEAVQPEAVQPGAVPQPSKPTPQPVRMDDDELFLDFDRKYAEVPFTALNQEGNTVVVRQTKAGEAGKWAVYVIIDGKESYVAFEDYHDNAVITARELGADIGAVTTVQPEAVQPEAVQPEAVQPEAVQPEPSNEATLRNPRGPDIQIRNVIVDASGVDASHDALGIRNKRYPDKKLQPRDRTTPESVKQIRGISNDLRPDKLGASPDLDRGAPIGRKYNGRLAAESGNARLAAIQEAYKKGKADEYRQYLLDEAESLGLSRADVEAVKNPVLIRERLTDLDDAQLTQFVHGANDPAGLQEKASVTAKNDAARISDDIMALYDPGTGGNIGAPKNKDFVDAFVASLGGNETAGITGEFGKPTKDGAARIKQAIFFKAYESDDLLKLYAVSTDDDGVKNILSALEAAAPAVVRARTIDPTFADGQADIAKTLVNAVATVQKSRGPGQSMAGVLAQGDIFTERDTVADTLAVFIDENMKSGKKLGEMFTDAAEYTENALRAKANGDLLGDAPVANTGNAVAYAAEKFAARNGDSAATGDMFAAAEAVATTAEPTEVTDLGELKTVAKDKRDAAVAKTISDETLANINVAAEAVSTGKKFSSLSRTTAAAKIRNAILQQNPVGKNTKPRPLTKLQSAFMSVYRKEAPQQYFALVRNSGTPQQHTPTQQAVFTNETKHRNAILQKNGVGTVIANLDSPEQVPPHVQALIKPGQRPRAMLVGNQIYVFTYNLNGIEDQRRAILHEVVGHYGVNGLYGNNEAALNIMLDKLYPSLSDEKLLADIQSTYGKLTDISTLEGRRVLVKEYIAHSAERLPEQDKRFFKRLWQLIRQQLRKWGMLNVPDAEIQAMLETSYANTFGNSGAQSAYLAQTAKVRAMKEQQEKEAPLTMHVAGQQEDTPVGQEQHAFTLADGTEIGSVSAVNGDEGVYLHNIDTVDDNWAKIIVLEELNRANLNGDESVLVPRGNEAFDKWLARDLGALDFTRADGSQWSRVNTGMAPGADQVNTRWYNAEQNYQAALGENAVNTPAFKKWFGDSKVVDADGKPLVVYHGTGVDFDTADKMLWGSVKPELANDYAQMREDVGYPDAKARVLPVFMDISTPFDADALPNSVTVRLLANEMLEQARARGKKFSKEDLSTLFASVEKAERGARVEESGPSYSRHQTWMDTQAYFGSDGSKALQDMFAQTDFDGIKMHENGSLTFGVFKPEQIKSAVGNRGTFDPNDPRINFALAGDPATAVEASRYSQFIDSVLAKAYNAIPDNRVKAGLTKLYTKVNSGINPSFEGLHAGVALEGKRAETLGGLDQASNFGTRLMNNSLEERFQNETTLGEQNDWMNDGMVIADAPKSLKDNPADLAFLLQARDYMIALGETLVEYKKKFDKGISEETFNENKDKYAVMLYIDYLEYSGSTSGKKLSAQDYFKQRGLSDKVTKAVLGEIKNPYFRLGHSIATVGRDVAITGYAGFIAEHTPLAIPASVDNLDDLSKGEFTNEDGSTFYKTITLRGALVKLEKDGYLENDAGRVDAKLRSPHTMTEKPIRDLAAGRVDELRDEVWAKTAEVRADIEKRTGVTFKNKADWLKELKENYVFADSPRYGPLNGTYLRKEIKDDFDEAINPADDKDSPVWKATKAWYNEWKKLKVPLNPVSQIRNGFGNWFLLDMSTDTNSATLVGDTASVFKSFVTLRQSDIDIRKKEFDLTDNAQLARHITFVMGGGATSFSSAELGSSKSQLMKVVNEIEKASKGKSNIARHMHMARVWTKYSDVMTANYQLMEQIFKSAAVKDYLRQVAKQSGAKDGVELWAALENKMVDDGAGGRISAQRSLMRNAMTHANKAIFDYSKVHPLINKARRSPIGLPFVTFALKSIPAVADAYIHRPQKMIKYHAIPALMAGMATDWDDDELEQIRRDRPEYMRKSGSVFVMPWKQDDKYIWGDTSYLLPQSVWWNSIKTLSTWNEAQNATEAGMNIAGGLLTATGITTQPLFSLMTAAATGENTFSHRSIVREGATPGERAADVVGYGWDFMAPSTFNTTSPARDLLGYLTGWPDEQLNTRTGEPKRTAGQNVARAFGINTTAIDPAQQRQTNRWVQQKKVQDAVKERSRIARDKSLSPQERANRLKAQNEEIKRRRAQVGQ